MLKNYCYRFAGMCVGGLEALSFHLAQSFQNALTIDLPLHQILPSKRF